MNRGTTRTGVVAALSILAWTGAAVVFFAEVPASAQTDTNYMLVATITPPGTIPDHDGPVLRWRYTGTGPVTALSSIPRPPDSSINDPASVAFSAQGELFVGNRHYDRGGREHLAVYL